MSRHTLLAVAFALLATASAATAENWPQWRGPKNDGHSAETGLPTEWGGPIKYVEREVNGRRKRVADGFTTPPKNIVWQYKLPGRGSSTPCIWDDRIFVTAQDQTETMLLCVGTDGKEKWRRPLGPAAIYKDGDADNASASPSTDGKHVWAGVGSGKLACFDFDGKQVWATNLQKYGKIALQFGPHWTPVQYKGKLYLQVMHRNAQKLVCLDAATGTEQWVVDRLGYGRGESPDVYASAFIWEGQGGPLLIAHGNDYCTAHKLEDGAEVWRVAGLNPRTSGAWRFVSCPLCSPDLIVVPSCKDGPTVGINPVGAKGTINPENKAELWRFTSPRTPDVVSPVRIDDIVYLQGDGPLTAIEAKTGKAIYQKSLARQIHRGNMVVADGKIYTVGREGIGEVIQGGREFKLLATNPLPDTIYGSPAIANGRIYLRGYQYLWAIGTK